MMNKVKMLLTSTLETIWGVGPVWRPEPCWSDFTTLYLGEHLSLIVSASARRCLTPPCQRGGK